MLPVETQVEDPAVTFRQSLHQGSQGHGVEDPAEGRVLDTDQAAERGFLTVPGGLVQGTRTAFVHRPQCGQHAAPPEPGVLGDLLRGGRAATELLFELLDGPEDLAARLLERPGQPYGGRAVAQVPPELTGDLGKRVRQEGVAQGGVVAVDGLDQSQGSDLEEVVEFLPAALEAARDAVGHRQQPADDVVPKGGPARSRRVLREFAQQRVELFRGRLRYDGVTRPDHAGG